MIERTVLVTGASRGIGQSIALRLASQGWSVLSPTRDELDLDSYESVRSYLERLSHPIDGVVLCAAVNSPQRITDLSLMNWGTTLQTNLQASLQLLTALLPGMEARGFGRVVAVSSMYAQRARGGRAAYGMTKAALEALVRFVTVECAHKGVLANAVAPGFVDTELTQRNNDPASIAQITERIPVGRLASPEEVAEAVAFLASPSNTYITGQILAVDGGWSCT